jgi:hypothetical protein
MRAIALAVSGEIEVLGSGAEVAERRGHAGLPQHGVYYAAMLELHQRTEATAPLLLLAEPSILTLSPDGLLRPIALQGGALWLPERAAQMREAAKIQECSRQCQCC